MEEIELKSAYFNFHTEVCDFVNEYERTYPDTFAIRGILGDNMVGYTIFYYI